MDVRERLRNATAQIHEGLHGAVPFARIAAGTMDRAGYVELLLFLYRYHSAFTGLCAAGAARLEAPVLADAHRARLEALKADLAFLRCQPVAANAIIPEDGDFAAGCLYTVQGSTLGGKLIHRQLQALLPDGQGRSFFQGSADDGAQWQLFCRRLEASELDLDQVKAGAFHAFAQFKAMLDESELAVACE